MKVICCALILHGHWHGRTSRDPEISNSEKASEPLDRIQPQSFPGGSSGQRIDYRPFSNERPIANSLVQPEFVPGNQCPASGNRWVIFLRMLPIL